VNAGHHYELRHLPRPPRLSGKFFDDSLFALQLLEPVYTSAKDGNLGAEQNLSRQAFPYRRPIIGWRLTYAGVVKPVRNPLRLVVVKDLMNAAGTQSSAFGDLANGQVRFVSGDHCPDTLAVGVIKPRGGKTQATFELDLMMVAVDPAYASGICFALPFMTDYGNIGSRRSRWELSFDQSYRVTPNIIFGKASKRASISPA
jgi:hypothetical protein